MAYPVNGAMSPFIKVDDGKGEQVSTMSPIRKEKSIFSHRNPRHNGCSSATGIFDLKMQNTCAESDFHNNH